MQVPEQVGVGGDSPTTLHITPQDTTEFGWDILMAASSQRCLLAFKALHLWEHPWCMS